MSSKLFSTAIAGVLALTHLASGARELNDASHTPAPGPTVQQVAPYGYAVAGPVQRTVRITDATKYIKVTRLETVRLDFEGNSMVWNFDTLGTHAFPLSKILPSATRVMVYVEESPLYIN